MTKNRWIVFGLPAALVALLAVPALLTTLHAQDQKGTTGKKPAPLRGEPFLEGRILLIQRGVDVSPGVIHVPQNADSAYAGHVLRDAVITEIAGMRMLSGYGLARIDDKPVGPRIHIPLTQIGSILEFASEEEFTQFEEQEKEKMNQALELPFDLVPVNPAMPGNEPDA
ncbi:MAG: hypothetical protein JSS02_06310 [Planctomycetes bacterium]|nr:hypothetical protein [Planctomycetota bacterium]